MPVKVWNRDNGALSSRVETSRGDSYGGERYRSDAEALDQGVDRMLDRAVELSASAQGEEAEQRAFVRCWAVGRALAESELLQSEHLEPGERESLWLAIARKCRLGVRADSSLEEKWRTLVPNRTQEPKRTERDIFAMGLWLQEQCLDDALATFGGRLSNAKEIQRRESLRSVKLRSALCRWLQSLDPSRRARFLKGSQFVNIAKVLQRRWPSRGPGSAKRPVHFTDHDLDREVHRVLAQMDADVPPATAAPIPLPAAAAEAQPDGL